uniref:DNA-directed RNA polymerase n=1 Tax=Ecklonia radicosa TaxID=169786 RepID=A0A8F0FAH0_9PHAE|nr:RNA polymerase alpha subunit [Ecklonia cava]QWK43587.1 RNA polymerase alpha subunit [Ecklonia radicosa]WAM63274.1 RNA polymerase alpha subunit [Ecklonia cava]WAM63415.1 RNA polymerase alpha subunit [Ecklonia cava subsp. stolonifera]
MKINSKCKCVDLDLLNRNEFYGHFVFTSLEQSEGTTIGNMLRRALLSNLYGFRITGVRVAGVNNEFTPLEGVREDLLEIILNLKEIIIYDQNNTGEACYGLLKAQGPAIITAGALTLPNGIKVLNPSIHLLTISDESVIELAIKIEYGKSYILAKNQKLEGATDFIPIDSNFAPVLKVNSYIKPLPQDVENTNEELHLEIFTNGTLLPHQALIQARNMIGYMLSTITNMEFPCFDYKGKEKPINKDRASINTTIESDKTIKKIEIKSEKEKTNINKKSTPEERLLKRVTDMESGSLKGLGLSNRIIKALNKVNINFTWDLMEYPSPNLITIEGLGPKSVEEIKNKLTLFYEPPND